MSKEAMKLALEALEGVSTWVEVRPKTHPWDTWKRVEPAIIAIREALAEQPAQQQEPVAWISEVRCVGSEYGKKRYGALPVQSLQPGYYAHTPLYTSPPAQRTWVGLTEEETGHWAADFLDGAKWAEAKLREKNT